MEAVSENQVVSETSLRERSNLFGDWYLLGEQQQILKQSCVSLKREFEQQSCSVKDKSPSLAYSLDSNLWHVTLMGRNIEIAHFCEANLGLEVNKWCTQASLFLRNRLALEYILECGENYVEEDEIDGPRRWPPPLAHVDFFRVAENFDLLKHSADALYQRCLLRSVDYPSPGSLLADELNLKDLEERYGEQAVKSEWRELVVDHLQDLISVERDIFYSETPRVLEGEQLSVVSQS